MRLTAKAGRTQVAVSVSTGGRPHRTIKDLVNLRRCHTEGRSLMRYAAAGSYAAALREAGRGGGNLICKRLMARELRK